MAQSIETLDALMSRIVDLDARKLDLIADTRKMSSYVNGADRLRLTVDTHGDDLQTFALNPNFRGQLANDLRIPKAYFDRMSNEAPELLKQNVNHWLNANVDVRRMIRAYQEPTGNVGRAWLSDAYRRLDHIEIARKLLPEFENLGTEIQFHQASVTDDKLYIRALFPRIEGEIKVGDTVRWGVEIRNSETGRGTLSIGGFVLRLACINGMVVSSVLNKRHVGRRLDDEGILSDQALRADDRAFWLAARDMLKAAISETRFEEVIEQLRATTEGREIVNVPKATEVLQSRFSLSEDEKDILLTKIAAGGDLSRWGALNGITAMAKTVESFDRQAELEEAGWELAQVPAREWDQIALAA